ncbi:hypothetical protein Y032_0269g817 [Ancylostoma ceylanicum]|nr:hypothetical protein Y032_0269g817 [Ancylostoma ceylanicum]
MLRCDFPGDALHVCLERVTRNRLRVVFRPCDERRDNKFWVFVSVVFCSFESHHRRLQIKLFNSNVRFPSKVSLEENQESFQ